MKTFQITPEPITFNLPDAPDGYEFVYRGKGWYSNGYPVRYAFFDDKGYICATAIEFSDIALGFRNMHYFELVKKEARPDIVNRLPKLDPGYKYIYRGTGWKSDSPKSYVCVGDVSLIFTDLLGKGHTPLGMPHLHYFEVVKEKVDIPIYVENGINAPLIVLKGLPKPDDGYTYIYRGTGWTNDVPGPCLYVAVTQEGRSDPFSLKKGYPLGWGDLHYFEIVKREETIQEKINRLDKELEDLKKQVSYL